MTIHRITDLSIAFTGSTFILGLISVFLVAIAYENQLRPLFIVTIMLIAGLVNTIRYTITRTNLIQS
jgi:hypothetical protein